MKTFADCKIGDEMYLVFNTSYKIEKITKIDDRNTHLWIHTENYLLSCPKYSEKHHYMFCTRDLESKILRRRWLGIKIKLIRLKNL